MNKLLATYFFVLIFCFNSFAALRNIPLDELVKDSDLIVIGTLQSVSEFSYGGENKGEGMILVEQIILGNIKTHKNLPLKSGDKLKLVWNENFSCVYGIHKRTENQKGIWFLRVETNGTVIAGHPNMFKSSEQLTEVMQTLEKAKLHVGEAKIVDTSGRTYSLINALLAAFSSLFLYYFLYRSRFKIR